MKIWQWLILWLCGMATSVSFAVLDLGFADKVEHAYSIFMAINITVAFIVMIILSRRRK